MLYIFEFLTLNRKYQSISPQEVKKLIENDKSVLLVDVRTLEEYRSNHIPNSISVPLDRLSIEIEKLVPNKGAKLILYCQSGARSSVASNQLAKMGYTNISNMGSIMSWTYETVRAL